MLIRTAIAGIDQMAVFLWEIGGWHNKALTCILAGLTLPIIPRSLRPLR